MVSFLHEQAPIRDAVGVADGTSTVAFVNLLLIKLLNHSHGASRAEVFVRCPVWGPSPVFPGKRIKLIR